MNIRDTAQVTAITPVDGRKVRKARKAGTSASSRLLLSKVPDATLKVALKKVGDRIDLLRCIPEPGALGGWAIMVFNSREQAREWDRTNRK